LNLKTYKNQVVWLIGASTGIGAALAHRLKADGAILALSARTAETLQKLADEIGAEKVLPFDVADGEALSRAKDQLLAEFGRIDRVVFLPALYGPMSLDQIDMQHVRSLVEVNLVSAYSLVQQVYPAMLEQGSGQLSFCASISGFSGLPQSQPYASTKAALISLTESLRAEAEGSGVDIKLINPGFVRTPLTDKNKFKMPFIVEPEVAAERIARGLMSAGFEILFPRRFAYALRWFSRLPYWLKFRLMRRGLKKVESQRVERAN
jgi:short-subunit dehydrogenase